MAVSSRSRARHAVLQALYAYDLSGDTQSHVHRTALVPRLPKKEGAAKLATDLFQKVIEERELLDRMIAENIENWDITRIHRVDLMILRMALCEFLHFYHIPPKATMNEAIEMAKMFSTEESKDFINGVLDTIAFKLRKGGRMFKSERGLQGWEEMVHQQEKRWSEP